jgi:hypothetical protein
MMMEWGWNITFQPTITLRRYRGMVESIYMVDMVESIPAIMRGSILGRKGSSRLQYFDTRFRQMQI